MGFLYVAGELGNLVSRGQITASSENSLFPASLLGNGIPSEAHRFNAAGVDDWVRCDLDLLLGVGDADDAADLTAWDGSGGTFSRDAAVQQAGTHSFSLAHTGLAQRTIDVQVRAGERLRFEGYARGDATVAGRIRVRNRETGSYLTSAGAWQAASTELVDQTASSFADGNVADFTVESLAVCRRPVVTLRITLELEGSGEAWFDSIAIWPWWDFLSVHFHNLGPVSIDWQSSDNAWAASASEATPTIYAPTFFSRLGTPQSHRYVGLELTGTNHEAASIGEWFVGYATQLGKNPGFGWRRTYIEDDLTSQTPLGQKHVIRAAEFRRRRVEFDFIHDSKALSDEWLDEVGLRCRGRVFPLVVVPDSDRPELTVFGRKGPAHTVSVHVGGAPVYTTSVAIEEEPGWSRYA